ncbi:EscC/YscC/HrcC family type III secretion system outer membrane ring protein [Candidatus Regiella insecticola]|uniref:Type 3 secretion system secretin n=1 Tax=Candidatus Regiella insecticola TaxID=138073 RepID=A0A6L2ZRP7_9ENTR|nr:EscC/YscC/HrcC family type III secretion system outer membrane ring protein [Candidatus Regiella insecticola]GFN47054.1 escC/YscC/HrcC family type III secretion system outer membrane ring protein [Candidatus Regiella insecticola]
MKKIAGLICLLSNPLLYAQPINWQGSPFFIYSRGIAVANLLQELGKNYGIPVIVSQAITESFSGKLKNQTPEEMLAYLSAKYNLTWYFDGDVLYFYKTQEIRKEIISPDDLSIKTLINYLRNSGLSDGKNCAVKAITSLNSLEVSGVPVCIERAARLTKLLNQQVRDKTDNKETVKVFLLKYASATDSNYQYRDQEVQLPGLVTVLREMSAGNALPVNTANGGKIENTSLPLFSADPRQNAVVVRDRQVNMPIYKSLINQLDIRPIGIEISVTIIDVDVGNINQLGIDWTSSTSLAGNKVSFRSGLIPGSNDSFSSVIGDTDNFMVRLKALQQNSRARVLSRPSVVTLNNIPAVLDKNITFYTKLQGDKVAKLESITSGSLLRVTPRMINDNGRHEVLLNLNIKDGVQKSSNNATEPLPQVQDSQISTQATLKIGQSLLLGGFIQDRHSETENKVPFLGDIPVIGELFRSTDKHSHSVVRLFLIKAVPVDTGH